MKQNRDPRSAICSFQRKERKLDQVVGEVKETAEKAVAKIKGALTGNRPRGRAK